MPAIVTVRVFRYDPSVDQEPRYDTFDIEWKEYLTALEALHYYNETISQFSYDFCCRGSLCGRCGIMLDGMPCLACYAPLEPGEHTIEPLSGFPVIKDLIVDKEFAMHRVTMSLPSTKTTREEVGLPSIEYDLYWNTLERLQMCRECMCCYSACMALKRTGKKETFIGPAALAQIALRHLDSEDMFDRVGQAVFSGLYDCIMCGECSKNCPSGIDHLAAFQILRNEADIRNLVPEATDASADFAILA
jgi:succinate dehydrogenase/fumarate reductase iron-sulfur protein